MIQLDGFIWGQQDYFLFKTYDPTWWFYLGSAGFLPIQNLGSNLMVLSGFNRIAHFQISYLNNQRFWTLFYIFTMLTFFFKYQKFETCKRLIANLFCFRCFSKFRYWFLAFTFQSRLWRIFLFFKIWFHSSTRIYKHLSSRITENSSHCYTLSSMARNGIQFVLQLFARIMILYYYYYP